jgi:hypothetical protein
MQLGKIGVQQGCPGLNSIKIGSWNIDVLHYASCYDGYFQRRFRVPMEKYR